MNDSFITQIQINNSRNIKDLTIPLSENERKHLIITGKNGSGKTSLLEDLILFLKQVQNGSYGHYEINRNALHNVKERLLNLSIINDKTIEQWKEFRSLEEDLKALGSLHREFGGTSIKFSNSYNSYIVAEKAHRGNYLIAYFPANRQASDLKVPTGINKVDLKNKYEITETANKDFVQYLVNLKAERSFAKDDGENDVVNQIDKWFENFEKRLREIFDSPTLELIFDRKEFNFYILEDEKLPFNFNTLSSGYSAIVSILTELILRIEGQQTPAYDIEGVVLIDELETHLHVELQKRFLPFITDFFPRIQFIVTTHSPFVLSSISNAIICDLEKRIVTEDLSGYSYDALIESYFDSDKYSDKLKSYIEEYETLTAKDELTEDEKARFFKLRLYLDEIPKFASDELAVKLQQIKLEKISKESKKRNDLPD